MGTIAGEVSCTVVSRVVGETVVVAVAGELDLATAPRLAAALAEGRVDRRHVVVDLGDVSFIDSTGLRELVAQDTATAQAGGILEVVPPRSPADRVFDLTGIRDRLAFRAEAPMGTADRLPDRIARHRTALGALGRDASDPERVARLVSDALGDACVLSVVENGVVRPQVFRHRVVGAQQLLTDLLLRPFDVGESAFFRAAVLEQRPVVVRSADLAPGRPFGLTDRTESYRATRGMSSVACLPLLEGRRVAGLLGASRDATSVPYDAEDEAFLRRVAETVGAQPLRAAR